MSDMPMRNWMKSDEFYEQLDPGIRFAVRVLHSKGVETGQSCQGGKGHCYDHPTVDLHGNPSDGNGFEALSILNTYGLKVREVTYIWNILNGAPIDAFWRVTLREPCHERADDMPSYIGHYQYIEKE